MSGTIGARATPPYSPVVSKRYLALVPMTIGLLVGCAEAQVGESTSVTSAPAAGGISGSPLFTADLPEAVAVNVAASSSGMPAVAWVDHESVHSGRLDIENGRLVDDMRMNGAIAPMVHPIERPAVLVDDGDAVTVAFTAPAGDGGSVYLSRGGAEPLPISGPPRPETNLVHVTSSPDGAAVFAWLEDSTLSVAVDAESGLTESEAVDDLTCDCCNSVPVFVGEDLVVAYRDLEHLHAGMARNVVAVRSTDGGRSFEIPVAVADDDWLLDGCPFSGPATAVHDGELLITWMDARQSIYPDQTAASIWFDHSSDGGAVFGTDLELASEGRFRWPTMAVDDSGIIHIVWETAGSDGGLSYVWSGDGGASFSEPELIVARTDSGAPGSPSLIFDDGYLVLTWADGVGGQVAVWEVSG
jgi:hypothetical protein